MLIKTKAIVLSKLKYRDNDLIVKCYTSNKGIVNYLIRGALKGGKTASKTAYFQPLSQLEVEENFKPSRSLQYLSDIKLDVAYQDLYTNIAKSAIVMFLSEVLSSILKEEEQNEALYDYLKAAFIWLDSDKEISNFHLLFLLNLTKYLGFYPDTTAMALPYFNLQTGAFEKSPDVIYAISNDNLSILKQLLGINFDALNQVKLNSKQRQSFLSMLLLYFELHLGDFKKPKSLSILNQVFNN